MTKSHALIGLSATLIFCGAYAQQASDPVAAAAQVTTTLASVEPSTATQNATMEPPAGSPQEFALVLGKIRLINPDQPHAYTVDGKPWVLYGYSTPSKGAAKRNPNHDLAKGTILKVECLLDGKTFSRTDAQQAAVEGAYVANRVGAIGAAAARNVFWFAGQLPVFPVSDQSAIYQITLAGDDGTTYVVQQEYKQYRLGTIFMYKPGDRTTVQVVAGTIQAHGGG